MLIFFLFISLANLALGYFVAVKFHAVLFPEPASERELVRSTDELLHGVPEFSVDASRMPLVGKGPALVLLPEEKMISAVAPQASDLKATMGSAVADLPLTKPRAMPETSPPSEEPQHAEMDRATSTDLAEVSVDDFMSGLSDFRAQLSALDHRVRQCAKSPDTRQIEGCVQEFREASTRYLEQTTEAKERLEKIELAGSAAANQAREAVQNALKSQVEEVRRTEDTLSQLNVEADPQGSCETILHTTQALATSNNKLRDDLQLAKREFTARTEASDIEPSTLAYDELTQIPSREMFDAELRRQLQRGGTYCLAIVDIDHCAQLNFEHGPSVTDELIKVIAQIVAASSRGACRAARYSGQQFAVLFPDLSPADGALAVESIRQIVHQTKFLHSGERLAVSVSATLLAGHGKETTEQIEKSLGESIKAAKGFGINQSFHFKDGKVTPILPPELDLEANSYEV